MNKLRKFLVVGVMVLSVIAMSGLPMTSVKAAASAGDLIKMDGLSSVYYLGNDGKRYVFPNEATYFSWYADFSGVVTIPASELQSYPLGGNVTMRPGTKLVKITTDPSVYAVEPNGVLRKIQNESQAAALYGTNWNKRIVDLADAFFTNYTIGSPLADGQIPAGSLVKNANSATVYYFDGTNYRAVASEAALAANRLWLSNVLTVTNTLTSGGTALSAMETALVNTAQNGGTGVVVTGSGLMVSLNSMTPASMNIPTGSPAEFLKINMTAANDGAVNVSAIKLTSYELGDGTNIDNVTFYDNGVKVGSSKNINPDREAYFSFATPIYVAAGTTKTLVVKATTAAAGDYALGLAKAADITASAATISGSFPIRGNKMSAAVSSNVGTLEISSVEDNNSATAKFGEDNVLLAAFNLKAVNEAALVSSIKFKNGGTNVADIISNLKMTVDGTEVSTGTYADGYVTFSLNNFKIEKNDSVSVEVRGDMGTTNANDTVKLYFKDRADIVAVGATYGYEIQMTTATFVELDATDDGIELTLESSDVTIDADRAATPAKDVKAGDNDVILATLTFKSNGENATLEEITGAGNFVITGTGLTADEVKNVRMVDATTGAQYDLDATFSTTTTDHYELSMTDEISLTKGVAKKFYVKADLNDVTGSEIDANDTLQVTVKAAGMKITGDVSNATIATSKITPSEVSGAIMTVKAASLAWNVTNMTAKSVVTGTSDVEVYAAKIKAGAADGVKINSLKLTATSGNTTTFSDNNITKLDLYIDGKLVKTVSNSINESAKTISFTSLTTNSIAANKEVDLVVKASFASTFTGATNFALGVAAEADIVAKSITGNKDVDITGGITGNARTVTLASVGTLKVELLTTDTNASQNQYVLAGATTASKYMGELKFTTANEPIKVKTLTLTDTGTAGNSDIASVRLVKADGTVVASKTVESDGSVVFDPFDVTFDADKSTSLFISPLAKGINVDGDAASTATLGRTMIYGITAVTAQGSNSGTDLTMTGAPTPSTGNWDNDATTKTFTITPVKLNSVVNALSSGKLSTGRQDIARYTLTFEHGANRDSSNDAYKAQLGEFVLKLNQNNATATNFTLKVEGTTREVAYTFASSTATSIVWNAADLQNATTGLLNSAKVDDVVTLVVSADIAIDAAANNYGIQTVIDDLNGTGDNDDIQYSGLTNMYLPYTSVTGANLTN